MKIVKHVVLGLGALLFAASAFGQGITTGTITGTVTDPSGAIVPGAQIQITDLATGVKLDVKSGGDGSFKFFAVPIGTYRALITAGGFANENVDNVQVVAGATTNLNDVKLQVGTAAAQVVEVNGSAAALLETTDSQVTTTFDAQAVQNLPLNNGFDTVVELIPGVTGVGDDNFSNSNGDDYSVNGQSSRYNNYEIDGQSNNDNSVGGTLVFFGNQDAIEQIQVITNQYSAQYGRNAGAVENYITKSGTNSFHGSGFDLYQSQFMSSLGNGEKNPLLIATPVLPRYIENRPGATTWITMPGKGGESSVMATKKTDGYRLDQYRAGRVIASFAGSFLFCHQRKMRLTWRNAACPDAVESLVDFRIRGNFAGSILELRHMSLQSASDFLWHQRLWSASLPRLASILRSA